MTQSQMKEAIQKALPDAKIEIQDTTGTNDHFDLVIYSDLFEPMSRLERHRCVLTALDHLMENNGGPVHAVAIQTHPLPKSE